MRATSILCGVIALLFTLLIAPAFAETGLTSVPDLTGAVRRIPSGGGKVVVSPRAYGTLPAGFDVDTYVDLLGEALHDAHGDRTFRPTDLGVDPTLLTDYAQEAANRAGLADRGVGVFIYLEAQPAVTRVDLYAYVYETRAPIEPLDCFTWSVTGAASPEAELPRNTARAISLDDLMPSAPAAAAPTPPPASPASALAALTLRPRPGIGRLNLRAWEEGDILQVDGAPATSKSTFNLAVGAHTIEVGRYGMVARYQVVINAGRVVDITLPTSKRGWQQVTQP